MKKNVAGQFVGIQLVSKTDGSNITTGTTTVYVTGDAGTQAAGSVGSGACTHEGKGAWTYAPAQAETNYDHVAFTFENTAAVTATVQIYPSFPQTGDNFARLGAPAGASVSADIAAVKVDTAAVKAKTDNLPTDPADQSLVITATDNIMTRLGTPVGASLSADLAAVQTSATDLSGRLPTALVSGRIDASVGAIAANVITATSIAADAITAAKIADGAIDAGTFASAAITAAAIATDAIGAAELAAGAVDKIADQIWDEVLSGHAGVGTTGAALSAAGGSGDPWSTALPGAYGAGTAGFILGTNLNATVSSRASQASVDTIDDFLDTEVAAIKTQTDKLTFTTANRVDSQVFGIQASAITATSIAADAITAAKIADGAIDAATFAAAAITATAIAADAITDAKVASDVTIASVTNAVTLTSGERDSIASAMLDLAAGVETGLTVRGALRLAGAVLAGKVSGAGTGTEVFRNAVADSKARVTATVDVDGNRTAITTDVT